MTYGEQRRRQQAAEDADGEDGGEDGDGDWRCKGDCRLGWPLSRGACGNAWCSENKNADFGCITCKIRLCKKPECLNNHLFEGCPIKQHGAQQKTVEFHALFSG